MPVIKLVLSGFYRRQRTQNQNLGAAVINRGEWVRNMLIFHVIQYGTKSARRVVRVRYPKAVENLAIHICCKLRP